MKALKRKSTTVANSRWLAYATAGAASAFAAANSAEATIHYSGQINKDFSYGRQTATFQLDRPGDSIRLIHFTTTSYAGHAYFGVAGRVGESIVGFHKVCGSRLFSWASNLEEGQFISFQPSVPAHMALLTRAGIVCNGQFNRAGLGHIGFKFNNGNGDQYGWVRIQTRGNLSRNFILRDYAYGDVGDRIRAGQTSSNDVPELESLGGLALGALGLLAWRKGRSQAG